MSPYAIVTDTDASLPAELADAYGIGLVPINIHFGHETYLSGIDIDDARLFDRVNAIKSLPTTSAPVPGAFAEAYRQALDAGNDGVICFCVSSAMSATYSSARLAAESLPAEDITVVDSQTLSMAQGFMAMTAAEAARTGASKAAILAAAEHARENTVLYGALSTLKYLAMSGRVPQIAAGMASLLNIRPILSVQEGRLDMLEKVRTRRRAWARMEELCNEAVGDGTVTRWAVVHVNAREEALALGDTLRQRMPALVDAPIVAELSPGLSVHTGSGLVGVSLVRA